MAIDERFAYEAFRPGQKELARGVYEACLKKAGERDSYLMLSRLPALRRAFQAAGRHVRRLGKRGTVFLLDERFGSQAARDLIHSWLKSKSRWAT